MNIIYYTHEQHKQIGYKKRNTQQYTIPQMLKLIQEHNSFIIYNKGTVINVTSIKIIHGYRKTNE